jgi:hypothetical protein
MYVFFGFLWTRIKGQKKKKNLFTVLTEEPSIPDDDNDDKWDK